MSDSGAGARDLPGAAVLTLPRGRSAADAVERYPGARRLGGPARQASARRRLLGVPRAHLGAAVFTDTPY